MNTMTRTLVFSVVMMACAIACRGAVILTWLDEPIGVGGWWNPSTPQPVDIDGNGVADYSFWGDQFSIFASFRSEGLNRYLIIPDPPPNSGGGVATLNEGFLIGPDSGNGGMDWFNHPDWATLMKQYDTGRVGPFWGIRAYIGIEFQIGEATHYGWIDVEGDVSLPHITVYGWAYESTPGIGIIAGAIPEPSTLLLLMGGIGLLLAKSGHRGQTVNIHFRSDGGSEWW